MFIGTYSVTTYPQRNLRAVVRVPVLIYCSEYRIRSDAHVHLHALMVTLPLSLPLCLFLSLSLSYTRTCTHKRIDDLRMHSLPLAPPPPLSPLCLPPPTPFICWALTHTHCFLTTAKDGKRMILPFRAAADGAEPDCLDKYLNLSEKSLPDGTLCLCAQRPAVMADDDSQADLSPRLGPCLLAT